MTERRRSRGRRPGRGAVVALAGGVVVAVSLTAFLLGRGPAGPAVRATTAASAAQPSLVGWSPAGLEGVAALDLRAAVDEDRGLFFGAADRDDRDDPSGHLIMLDLVRRTVLWQVPATRASGEAPNDDVGLVVGDVVLLTDSRDRVQAFDLESGALRSEAGGGWHVVGCDRGCPDLGGDVLLSDSTRVRRVAADDLRETRWTATMSGYYLGVLGDRGFGDDGLIDLRTGEPVAWAGPRDGSALAVDGRVIREVFDDSSERRDVLVLDVDDASTILRFTTTASAGYSIAGDLIIHRAGNAVRAVDLDDGRLRWSVLSRSDDSTPAVPELPEDSGLVAMPNALGDGVQVVDARTGGLRFELPRLRGRNRSWTSVADVDGGIVLIGGARIVRLDSGDGHRVWSAPFDGDAMRVAQVGDHLVATDPGPGALLAILDLG